MLSPKKTKFRKQHRGRLKGKASRGNKISFGDYAIQALEPTWLTSRQIEATRRTITRYTKRGGKLWISVSSGRSDLLKRIRMKFYDIDSWFFGGNFIT